MMLARSLATALACAGLLVASGCQKDSDEKKKTADKPEGKDQDEAKKTEPGKAARPRRPEIPAPDDVKAPPADAKKTKGGVSYKILTAAPAGTAAQKPGPNDTVVVHYTGWTTDGKMFDSSVARKHPARFSLGSVIQGWTEGLQEVAVGEKARLWIPEELAYKGMKGAPEGMLVFDVELQEVVKAPEVPSDVAAAPKDAKKTAKGVFYKVLTPGTGKDKPHAWDRVKVQYTGWTTEGKMFDSSVTKGRPGDFSLQSVMPGWTDGVQTMVVGQKNRFWIPEELAYKDRPGRPQGMLVFDIELLEIKAMPEPPAVPKDVAAPPKDAQKTAKGVFYKVLKKGTGKDHPTASSRVTVHYSGWTTDGKMFDSSVVRGEPTTFPLSGVIKGWTEGVQLMTVGEKTRFWIPADLAYGSNPRPGAPSGMLVFDIELISMQ
jgi:FKBP-type peptidyl-prolyl cis-trans isomerase